MTSAWKLLLILQLLFVRMSIVLKFKCLTGWTNSHNDSHNKCPKCKYPFNLENNATAEEFIEGRKEESTEEKKGEPKEEIKNNGKPISSKHLG